MSTRLKLKNVGSAKAQQHPFHIVDPTPLPLFMATAIVLLLLHIAFLSHPDYPIHDEGIFLKKLLEDGNNYTLRVYFIPLFAVLHLSSCVIICFGDAVEIGGDSQCQLFSQKSAFFESSTLLGTYGGLTPGSSSSDLVPATVTFASGVIVGACLGVCVVFLGACLGAALLKLSDMYDDESDE